MTQELSVVDQDKIARMRALSGEDNQQTFLKISTIEIDNSKVDTKLESGRTVKVLCDPQFITSEKQEDGSWQKIPFAPSFEAIILKVRYKVDKKWEEKSTMEYFSSYEFDNFKNGMITIKQGQETFKTTYDDFKVQFEKKYNLWMHIYVVIGDSLYRVKVKGESRSAIWDYMKVAKEKFGSMSAVMTNFGLEQVSTDSGIEYYNLKLSPVEGDGGVDIDKVITYQTELNNYMNSFESNREATNVIKQIGDGRVVTEVEVKFDGEVTTDEVEANINKVVKENGTAFN